MRAIVTVIGRDTKGIIAAVSTYFSDRDINIEDISQTIMQQFFTMVMLVDLSKCKLGFQQLSAELSELGKDIGVSVSLQHEDIFNAMHKL